MAEDAQYTCNMRYALGATHFFVELVLFFNGHANVCQLVGGKRIGNKHLSSHYSINLYINKQRLRRL